MKKSEIIKRQKQLLLVEALGLSIIVGSGFAVSKNISNQRAEAMNRLASIEFYAPDKALPDIDALYDIQFENYESRFASLLGMEVLGSLAVGGTTYYFSKELDKKYYDSNEENQLKKSK